MFYGHQIAGQNNINVAGKSYSITGRHKETSDKHLSRMGFEPAATLLEMSMTAPAIFHAVTGMCLLYFSTLIFGTK
jgi:hypothetical protein